MTARPSPSQVYRSVHQLGAEVGGPWVGTGEEFVPRGDLVVSILDGGLARSMKAAFAARIAEATQQVP